jgi:hypothetical protein
MIEIVRGLHPRAFCSSRKSSTSPKEMVEISVCLAAAQNRNFLAGEEKHAIVVGRYPVSSRIATTNCVKTLSK